jgi:hypothetical protein
MKDAEPCSAVCVNALKAKMCGHDLLNAPVLWSEKDNRKGAMSAKINALLCARDAFAVLFASGVARAARIA